MPDLIEVAVASPGTGAKVMTDERTDPDLGDGVTPAGVEYVAIMGGGVGEVSKYFTGLSTGAPVQKLASETAITLSAANADRRQWFVYNNADTILYVKFGTGATTSDWNMKVLPGRTWELPVSGGCIYAGIITGIWAIGVNTALYAQVTEVTP